MNETSRALGDYLTNRFEEKNREEGRSYEDPLTWRELSLRMDIPETSLIRWKSGISTPANPDHIARLASEFGLEVMVVLGLIDRDTVFYIQNRDNPDVKRIMRSIREKSTETARDLATS